MGEETTAARTSSDGRQGWDRFRVASWLAALILAASLILAGWGYLRERRLDLDTRHDNAVMIASERLLSSLKDIETGQRGFIITGKEGYLEPYHSGSDAAGPDLDAVVKLIGPDASFLSGLVDERLKEATAAIETYRTEGPAAGAARIQTGDGKAAMDRVRVEVAREQKVANDRLLTVADSRAVNDALRIGSLAGLILSCAGLGYVAVQRRREHRASQALLDGVLENAPIGLGFLDRSLRVRHANQALARMSERALGATPGMTLWDVLPEMRDVLESKLRQVVEAGRTVTNVDVSAPNKLRPETTRDFQASFYPLQRTEPGTASDGVGMVIADVTARKRAERQTKEGEERFRTLVEASASIIWTADGSGAFIEPQPHWNRFTGQTTEEAMGWGRLESVHPEDVDRLRATWRTAVETRTPIAAESRLRRRDGAFRHMALSVAPVLREDGTIREWVGSHTDITERKEDEALLSAAKEAAEAANRAKSAFLANMSHELRTPLSAVIGYSEMMEEEVEDMGEHGLMTDLGKIKSNARHLLSLINDVLDLSKIEANRMDTFAEDVEVAGLVEEVAETVGTLVEQKNNRLVIEVAPDVGAMHTDVVKVRQCLFNLLSNASKFTENGRVTLQRQPGRRAGRRHAGVPRQRHGDRDDGGTARQAVPALCPGRRDDDPQVRRYGPGTRAHARLQPAPRGRHHGREHARASARPSRCAFPPPCRNSRSTTTAPRSPGSRSGRSGRPSS